MSRPYAILSDIHAHSWSMFAKTNEDGVNSRLQIIIDEIDRAATELDRLGGHEIILAGDLFHVRGSIDPEVFNPVHAKIQKLCEEGFHFRAIPGNHDLKGKETTELGNAIQTLGALEGFQVISAASFVPLCDEGVMMLPWCSKTEDLKAKAVKLAATKGGVSTIDLIIHAGIDGVLPGLPDHGLTAEEIASWGFRRVFAGHYHNHKVLEGGKVISIGATTHQTFGDVGTKAGFLLVWPDRIEYRASHAPQFVDLTADTDPDEIPLLVDGNYVRVRGLKMTDVEVNQMREELVKMGAKGTSFQVAREVTTARTGGKPAKAKRLEELVAAYIDASESPHIAAAKAMAEDILTAVRAPAL